MADPIDVALTLNRQPVRLRIPSDRRLLDLLREDLHLTGAKEGCGKGECGSCTVLVNGQAVNACLMMAYQADGAVVESIEGLAEDNRLHPLQDAFVDKGAVQCGFCIPGMVLAAKALLDRKPQPTADEVREGISGNLCRCTGYAKVLAAVTRAVQTRPSPRLTAATPPAAPRYYRPRSLEEALEILAQRAGEAQPLAGGTDLLVEAQDGQVSRAGLFDLTAIPEIKGVEDRGNHVFVGAVTTHAQIAAAPIVLRHAPALAEACAAIGGPQIRNRGTLGGNLANAAPTADTAPALFVADAVVELVSVSSRRDVAITDLFTGPHRTVLAADELIASVRIPKRPGVRAAFLRLSQRQGLAVSKLSLAAAMTFKDGHPDWVRIALGGVAPTVVRAFETEKALMVGGYEALRQAQDAVRQEIEPADDLRSTAEYRREMAAVLLARVVRRLAEA